MTEGEAPTPKRGNRRARAVAAGLVMVVAVAFVVSSTWQITAAVFFAAPKSPRPPTPAEADCARRLRTLESALQRAAVAATAADGLEPAGGGSAEPATDHGASEARARRAFEAALAPEWSDTAADERACEASPRSREAWAALLRLRRGLEGRARKDAREIGPLERDFETRLP